MPDHEWSRNKAWRKQSLAEAAAWGNNSQAAPTSWVALASRLGGVSEQAGGGAEVGEDDLAGPV